MFESIMKFLRKMTKKEEQTLKSKDAAKERLHLVLMQDRANVSADFLDLMKQEIIEVIKKYIDIDESAMDVRLTNKGEPVIQNRKAPSGKAYLEIAKRVLGENIEVTIPGREKGFFAKLKSLFKK